MTCFHPKCLKTLVTNLSSQNIVGPIFVNVLYSENLFFRKSCARAPTVITATSQNGAYLATGANELFVKYKKKLVS